MGIPFFVFFSVTHKIGLFSPNRTTQKTSSIPIFNAEDASGRTLLESARAYASSGWGAPRSSRRALTPRCPPTRRKRRGRGFRRGGGRGGGRLGNLPEPAGARRRCRRHRSRRCRVNGGVVDACGGGCLFVYSNKINHHVCLKIIKLLSSPSIRATHDARPSNQLPPAAAVTSI